jgi:hypothetical protein
MKILVHSIYAATVKVEEFEKLNPTGKSSFTTITINSGTGRRRISER